MKGRRRLPDDVDVWCQQWAMQRRIMLGIVDAQALEPRERLGALRCTLAAVREEREGAGQGTTLNQHWPEVYTGIALLMHIAYHLMPNSQAQIMNLHYVWREIPVKDKLFVPQISAAEYWTRLGHAKSFIRGYVAVTDNVRQRQSEC